jgi:hypothetical protein
MRSGMGSLDWNIKFFKLSSGRCPYEDFFDELQKEDQVRIRNRLVNNYEADDP